MGSRCCLVVPVNYKPNLAKIFSFRPAGMGLAFAHLLATAANDYLGSKSDSDRRFKAGKGQGRPSSSRPRPTHFLGMMSRSLMDSSFSKEVADVDVRRCRFKEITSAGNQRSTFDDFYRPP